MICMATDPTEATPGVYCTCCGQPARAPEADWIPHARAQRGWVSDARFGPGEQVIKRTNRNVTRAWMRSTKETHA